MERRGEWEDDEEEGEMVEEEEMDGQQRTFRGVPMCSDLELAAQYAIVPEEEELEEDLAEPPSTVVADPSELDLVEEATTEGETRKFASMSVSSTSSDESLPMNLVNNNNNNENDGDDDEDDDAPKPKQVVAAGTVFEDSSAFKPPDDVLQDGDVLTPCLVLLSHAEPDGLIATSLASSDKPRVLDVDTLVSTDDRLLVGRIEEVFGPVTKPFYAIKKRQLRENETEQDFLNHLQVGKVLSVVERTAVVIDPNQVPRQGTDRSNMRDEEDSDDDEDESGEDEDQNQQGGSSSTLPSSSSSSTRGRGKKTPHGRFQPRLGNPPRLPSNHHRGGPQALRGRSNNDGAQGQQHYHPFSVPPPPLPSFNPAAAASSSSAPSLFPPGWGGS